MRTFDERMADVSARMKTIKSRRRRLTAVAANCVCLVLLAAVLVMFVPFDQSPPDIRMYADSDYYELIQKINIATYTPPQYANNFQALKAKLQSGKDNAPLVDVDYSGGATATGADGYNSAEYVEVTDNQVDGIIEADIFKRSNEYIYAVYMETLYVYSIAGEDSVLVGSFTFDVADHVSSLAGTEMFLSADCKTVTVIARRWNRDVRKYDTFVIDLDVSDPQNISEIGRVTMRGKYVSSRMVDGNILLMTEFSVSDVDFSDEDTYLPQITTEEGTQYVAAADIYSPDALTSCNYTSICLIDSATLEVLDSTAFLSYSGEVYVSDSHIYTTRSYTVREENVSELFTEILCIGYDGETLEYRGAVTIAGSVKDQYSMDEYDGILRVVTTLNQTKTTYYDYGDTAYARSELSQNASLYCVSLDDFSVISQVDAFAPDNETAESVRFDGEKCYVCTARISSMKDPVYFFDLSDPRNITSTDTGTIDGYSSSLIQLQDGFLLGIGYSESRTLKLEVYAREGESVISVCAYEEFADFPEEYKAYLIDRENNLFGIPISSYIAGREYLLVHFDGSEIRELVRLPIETAYTDMVRACIVDGLLYVLFYNGNEAELAVTPIGAN